MGAITRVLCGFLKNLAVLAMAGIVAVAVLEGLSRLVWPVQYGHKSFAMDGVTPVYPATDMTGVVPSLTYRQRAEEFDVQTSHTARGFRGPTGGFMDPESPAEVFLGDSMTYGVGLSDEDTIPYRYCMAKQVTCANLGRPGTGTGDAVAILQRRLADGWRPVRVNLVMNVMTTAQFGGNDLTDNLNSAQSTADIATMHADAPGPVAEAARMPAAWERIIPRDALPDIRVTKADILEHSNLARLGYYVFAPMLRQALTPDFSNTQKQDALAITRHHLMTINDLALEHGFEFVVYLVHPMQDLTRNTWQETLTDITSICPVRVIGTAPALMQDGNPVQYYYALDGHVRPEGAMRIAQYMLRNG